MIGILDIDLGNLRSVSNAVDSLGYDCKLVLGSESWDDLTHLIVPGVGSYHVASQRLDERALRPTVRAFADSGRPVLGICLGMQLLSTTGEENGEGRGFDLVPGHVKKLDPGLVPIIPHTGWNSVELARKHPVFEKVKSGVDFYFVHSYHFEPRDAEDRLGETVSGQRFVSIVGRRNVLGFQFHPEKSQANGLRLLEGFCDWSGKW